MFERNQLAHLVFWPENNKSIVTLVDPNGVVIDDDGVELAEPQEMELASFKLDRPMLGMEIAKTLPADLCIKSENVTVVTMSGEIKVTTVAPFDTTVVTERPVISAEERLDRLEIREQRNEARQAKLARENRELREQILAQRDRDEVVEEPAQETEQEEGQEEQVNET